MTWVYLVCTVVLAAAALVAVLRMERGPSMLDRVVALDVVTAVVLASVALISAASRRTDLVPVLLVLSIVGFVGSVAIARFAAVEGPEEARILTKEELASIVAAQAAVRDEDAPVHDVDDLPVVDALDAQLRPGDTPPRDDASPRDARAGDARTGDAGDARTGDTGTGGDRGSDAGVDR